jgi:hypothetical protein
VASGQCSILKELLNNFPSADCRVEGPIDTATVFHKQMGKMFFGGENTLVVGVKIILFIGSLARYTSAK